MKHVVKTNLMRVSQQALHNPLLSLLLVKQLYTSSKMKSFSYRGGYGVMYINYQGI